MSNQDLIMQCGADENVMEVEQVQNLSTTASGNMSFELLLSPASAASPRMGRRENTPGSAKSLAEISEKLEAAVQRRSAFVCEKVKKVSVEQKIATAAMRRDELEKWSQEKWEKLQQSKLGVNKENRDNFIKERLDKIKEHEKRVEEVMQRKNTWSELEILEKEIKEKLQRAQQLREQKILHLKAKLSKQQGRVEEMRQQQQMALEAEREMCNKRLSEAEKRRDEILDSIRQKHREHDAHVKEVLRACKTTNEEEPDQENMSVE